MLIEINHKTCCGCGTLLFAEFLWLSSPTQTSVIFLISYVTILRAQKLVIILLCLIFLHQTLIISLNDHLCGCQLLLLLAPHFLLLLFLLFFHYLCDLSVIHRNVQLLIKLVLYNIDKVSLGLNESFYEVERH